MNTVHEHIDGKDYYYLKGFPMSPTSNTLYTPINSRLVKSNAGRMYESKVKFWSFSKFKLLQEIKSTFKDKHLQVDCVFVFPKSRLVSKKHTLKRLDYSNRIKCVHDMLAELIDIDDSYFVSGTSKKAFGPDDREYINITISATELESV